jgi:hypothetical protein
MALPAPDPRRAGGVVVLSFADILASGPGRAVLVLARVAFWSAAAMVALALCRRGLTLGDEGYLLNQASDLLAGKVLYRDLDLFVTPGIWYVIAGLFWFTGPSVIATRLLAAGVLLATMLVTRRIVRASGSSLWGDAGAGLVLVFAVWAWPAWSFSFYSPWAALAAMGSLACTLEWIRSRRGAWLVACGVLTGLSLAFKQNYGVFAAAGCVLAILLDEIALAPLSFSWRDVLRSTLRASLRIAAGGVLVVVPLVALLAWQGALGAAFESLVLRPFQGFVDAHSIPYLKLSELWQHSRMWKSGGLIYMAVPVYTTGLRYSWPWPAVSLVEVLHVVLFWIPPLAFAGLGIHGLRRIRRGPSAAERALLATTSFAAVFYLGIFPRADFNHLINVYTPVLAMLAAAAAVHFGQGRWRAAAPRRAAAAITAVCFLCFAGVAAVWMNDLRKIFWIPLEAPRAGVLVEPLAAEMYNHEIELIRGMTAEDEAVFALPGLSMIPFLAERPMPTRYYNYYAVHIGHDNGREAAREIEESGARVILADYNNFFSDVQGMRTYGSELVAYLSRTFRPEFTLSIQAHMLLARRDEPLPEVASRDLWMSCEINGNSGRYFREQLLFGSLYHSFRGAWGDRNERTTICQVQVPSQATLRVALELRQSALALEPAEASAQMWVLPDHGQPQKVFGHEWPLASDNACSRDIGEEFAVDLTPWEGEVVTLLLRSFVHGPIPMSTDMHGLSVMWNGGRIESPDYEAPSEDPPVVE